MAGWGAGAVGRVVIYCCAHPVADEEATALL